MKARFRNGYCLASTGTKDPKASDTLYVESLACTANGEHDAGGNAASFSRSRQGRCPTSKRHETIPLAALNEFVKAGVNLMRSARSSRMREQLHSLSRGTIYSM